MARARRRRDSGTAPAAVAIADPVVDALRYQVLTIASAAGVQFPAALTPEICSAACRNLLNELPDSGADRLQQLYAVAFAAQQLPAWRLAEGPDGPTVVHVQADRKQAGSFYTPREVALTVARRTLQPLFETHDGRNLQSITVLDPACGTGIFLVAAAEILEAAFPEAPREAIVGHCLHGVDSDAQAAAIARELLRAWAGADAANPNVITGDSLVALDWSQAFPAAHAAGGFLAVIGNPPWDRVKPFAREFLAAHRPDLLATSRTDLDRDMQRELARDATLAAAWSAYREQIAATASAIRSAGYALQGRGEINLWKVFVERALQLVSPRGRIGLVVPRSLCIDQGATALRKRLFEQHRPVHIELGDNLDGRFDISGMMNYALLVCEGGPDAARAGDVCQRADGHDAALPLDLVRLVSPDSWSLPQIRSTRDAALLRRIYRGAPLLGGPEAGIAWRREFDLTIDLASFNEEGDGAPLFEGKMIHQFRLDWAGRDAAGRAGREWIKPRPPCDARGLPLPRYHVAAREVAARVLSGRLNDDFRCALRLIQNARNARTLIATVIPPGVVAGNSLATALLPGSSDVPSVEPVDRVARLQHHVLLCGLLNSRVLDWVVRLKIDANLNMFHLAQLPLPTHYLALAPRVVPPTLALLLHAAPVALRELGELLGGFGVRVPATADDAWREQQAAAIDDAVADAFDLDATDRAHIAASFRKPRAKPARPCPVPTE